MNKITDDDLILLYYGEHDDPELASRVAGSGELSARFEALVSELQLADNWHPPHRDKDYGAEVWQRISQRLVKEGHGNTGRLGNWLAGIVKPRFSLAGALSITLLTALAFMLGRNATQDAVNETSIPGNGTAVAVAGIDSGRLLTHAVSNHLEQVNLVLTQFVNTTESGSYEAGYATDMLVANRLYRQAAATQGNHKLAAFLADLEPLLIELAHEAQSGSTATRERMQQEVKNGLLFRVRVMNDQLNNPDISV